jgi:hypothetical protein
MLVCDGACSKTGVDWDDIPDFLFFPIEGVFEVTGSAEKAMGKLSKFGMRIWVIVRWYAVFGLKLPKRVTGGFEELISVIVYSVNTVTVRDAQALEVVMGVATG